MSENKDEYGIDCDCDFCEDARNAEAYDDYLEEESAIWSDIDYPDEEEENE